jgi:hypothetical protein
MQTRIHLAKIMKNPVITAIAKDTAMIWVRQTPKGKIKQMSLPQGHRLEFKSIEIGRSANKKRSVYVQGRVWSSPKNIRYLSGKVKVVPSRLKDIWVLPSEWCWGVGGLPDVTVHWSLVEFGYQLDIFNEGEHVAMSCRDFGGNHKIDAMQEWLIKDAEAAAERLRKKFP